MSNQYDYRIEDPSVDRTDDFAEPKILVATANVTDRDAEQLFEKEKTELFKGLFRRPKESDVVVKDIRKSFEPYIIIGGLYEIRYLTERAFELNVSDNAESIFLLGEEILVERKEPDEVEVEVKKEEKKSFFDKLASTFDTKSKPASKPEIKIKGIENVHIKTEIKEARNYNGDSINPESLPDATLDEVQQSFLLGEGSVVPKEFVDIESFTQKLIEEYAERPEEAQRVLFEKLTLTDRKIIFYPIYWAQMTYKDCNTKQVRLDAITKKIESPKGSRYSPPPKGSDGSTYTPETVEESADAGSGNFCRGCGERLEAQDVYCPRCGIKV